MEGAGNSDFWSLRASDFRFAAGGSEALSFITDAGGRKASQTRRRELRGEFGCRGGRFTPGAPRLSEDEDAWGVHAGGGMEQRVHP